MHSAQHAYIMLKVCILCMHHIWGVSKAMHFTVQCRPQKQVSCFSRHRNDCMLFHFAGVDVIFDPVGGTPFAEALKTLKWGGQIAIIGFASGQIPKVPISFCRYSIVAAVVSHLAMHCFCLCRQCNAMHPFRLCRQCNAMHCFCLCRLCNGMHCFC